MSELETPQMGTATAEEPLICLRFVKFTLKHERKKILWRSNSPMESVNFLILIFTILCST